MKYLTDTEILKWNERLQGSGYLVYPLLTPLTNHPYILFRMSTDALPITSRLSYSMDKDKFGLSVIEIEDPTIRWSISFSVVTHRKEMFFELFKKLTAEPFGTKTIYRKLSGFELKNDDIRDIKFNMGIVSNIEEIIHKVTNRDYIKYTYNFDGRLSSIMAFISYLEDTINFFQEMWGYDEEGNEVSLLKYPIGTIVSELKDKSKDHLIIDYKYYSLDGKYFIDYVASEIINVKGSVIEYGKNKIFQESNITYSRNDRIDNILN